MLMIRVTLCLLITYQWHGSAASRNVSVGAGVVRIAGEANGSSTDAPPNIPVVKRSSNQAGFANELVERARAILHSAASTLFDRPHEYGNRNSREPTRKLGHDRAKEKGNARIKSSSIQVEDATILVEPRLIGKSNSSPLPTKLQRRFHYEGASTIRHKRNEPGALTELKKEYKKSSLATDRSDLEVTTIQNKENTEGKESKFNGFGRIDSNIGNAQPKRINDKDDDDDAGGFSNRLSSRFSKVTSYSIPTSGEINKLVDSRRLHQQSRNTKPQTIAHHLRRNIKRQILSLDKNLMYERNVRSNYNGNENARRFTRIDDETRHLEGPELRFIPSHPLENNIYFAKYGHKSLADQGSGERNILGNPRAIEKFPRFEAAQIESLKGVFEKYDATGRDRNEFPNVRMILPKEIFVAPPRLVYHTKILPAPFAFPAYFKNIPKQQNNIIDSIGGVFDPINLNDLANRHVIPVRENFEPSELTDTVTPLPGYRDELTGNGQVSIRVNEASEDFANSEDIYRVGKVMDDREREASQRGGEDSRVNHESSIDVPTTFHNPGLAGSSYDNSVSTFRSADQSGSGRSVIEANTEDESPIRESATKSNDQTYYKWRPKYDNDNERYAANYSFGYRVSDYETNNNFGHQETRKEGLTRGKYNVKLPDGRIQEVDYHVDETGYHARVSYRFQNDVESLSR